MIKRVKEKKRKLIAINDKKSKRNKKTWGKNIFFRKKTLMEVIYIGTPKHLN